MKLQTHVKTGCGLGLLLIPVLGVLSSVFFVFGSILADIDHVLHFLWRSKFKKFWNFKYVLKGTSKLYWIYSVSPERKNLLFVFPFHTIEFLIIVLAGCLMADRHNLIFLSHVLFGFASGALFHIILDIIDIKIRKVPKAWSLIEYAIRKKKFLNQNKIYQEMLYKHKHLATPTK